MKLGCLEDPPTANTKNIVGLFVKAIAVTPENLISDGHDSTVEVSQIIKRKSHRFGKTNSGNGFVEVGIKPSPNTDGWLTDFKGHSLSGFPSGYKISSNFLNTTTADTRDIILSFIDAPDLLLQSLTSGQESIKFYKNSDNFETYITYFARSNTNNSNIPDGNNARYALRGMTWGWNAAAKTDNSGWKLSGNFNPLHEIELNSSAKVFVKGNTGETASTAEVFNNTPTLWIRDPLSSPPITTTTKRNIAVWRKQNGIWYVINADGTYTGSNWGTDYDIPVPGDYDGDGKADFAVFRPDNPATPENECQDGCAWYIVNSTNNALQFFRFGIAGDKPVPADYDGDGITDIAVYRPGNSTWYILNSSDHSYHTIQFGLNGDLPLPSDYDGDGFDDIAVWRASSATWLVINSSTQTVTVQAWGSSTDQPVIGDYDGDGKTDFATWQSNGNWHILQSSNGQTRDVNFGNPATDTAVPGNYDDDDKTDLAIWRPHGTQPAEWWILNSTTNQVQVQNWGVEGDIPVPAAYRR